MSAGTVTVSKKTLSVLLRFIREEISRLRNELEIINEELSLLERKYNIQSSEFIEMIEGKRKWALPEGSEPDVVEWEALLAQRKRLVNKLRELEELWRQLQDYTK